MGVRPAGTVTFLFTDVAGSTRLWERCPDEMSLALARHDELCRRWFDDASGYVFATGGDGFAVAFARASDAMRAAVGLQQDLAREPWPEPAHLGVRMAIHTGETVERGGDYFGPTVNTAARLLAAGHAGQILVSDATRQVLAGDHELRDLGLHRLRDVGTPLRLWQLGHDDFPALRSGDGVQGNLPRALSPLVGRGDELAHLRDRLSQHRLVTLAGVGGVGKTRLALAVAADVAPAHEDGCWFVDFSNREATDDLAAVVGRTIGADATTVDRRLLVEHLRDRRALLVLDNCEHLVDGAAELVEVLLFGTNEIRLLATSREPLGVDAEYVHRVRSLAVPEAASDRDALVRSPAVTLFVDRASDVGAVVDVDAEVETVAQICRHLDGIPLAIELAAARARSMSPREILDRIDERFRLLGGARRSLERHRTLMATVRWSHDLLSDEERVVWQRLAIFASGFDTEAAEAVVARDDVVATLLSLVDKSMVQVDTTHARTRYWMLETLRQFAAERLAEAGDVDELRRRHCDHYLRRTRRDAARMRGPDEEQLWWEAALERDNVVVAAERLIDDGRAAELVATMTEVPAFWIAVARAEGRRLLEAAAPTLDAAAAARALALAAFLAWEAGDAVEALRLARQHVEMAEGAGCALEGWGLAALLIAGNFAPVGEIDRFVQRAMAVADGTDDDFLRAVIHGTVAGYRHRSGDPGWRDSLDEGERAGERLQSPSALATIAVCRVSEELRDPRGSPRSAIAALGSVGDRRPVTYSTGGAWFQLLAGIAYLEHDREQSLGYFREAVRAGDRLGSGIVTNAALEGVALTWAIDGRLADAAVLRAVAAAFFDAARSGRSEVTDRVRERLDGALHAALAPDDLEAAAARASALSRRELLDLVLADREWVGVERRTSAGSA